VLRKKYKIWMAILALSLPFLARTESLSDSVRNLRAHREAAILQEYVDLLSIPNVGSDKPNIRRNAEFIAAMMQRRGINAILLDGDSSDANPAVFGEIKTPGAHKTITFYAHYDGQPVNPAKWAEGLKPFTPVFITAPIEHGGVIIGSYKSGQKVADDWRIAARSAADDKAGVMTILNAFGALKEARRKLHVNIKFFFEGEEEQGSPHLDEILAKHSELLQTDAWVIADGPRHVLGGKSVLFGVRGDVNLMLTVYGPKRPLHSGNYGNWAPNPALRLASLLASMKDTQDRVTIAGYYDDVVPLSPRERVALAANPSMEAALQAELGIAKPDGNGTSMAELLTRPTLNINGIRSGDVGPSANNIIPSSADAVLDLRLAKGNTVSAQVNKVIEHIKAQGFQVIDHDPTDEERRTQEKLIRVSVGPGYEAQRTSMDSPIARAVVTAVQSTSQEPVVTVVSAGGSLPLILFERRFGAAVLTVPVVNYDNNQHAENENVQVRFLWDGIEEMAAIMSIQ
jgi:acetylornithine deacetylase/succinyl-diaminopimelate desuccinylase-like protein